MATAKKTSKPGLYANIHAKQERIAHGSGEKTRKPGSPGAPSEAAFDAAANKKAGKKSSTRTASRNTSARSAKA